MKKLTLGILAHVDAGKTTLSEALLYQTGEIRKPGRVDHGDSFFDDNTIERNRGITIFSKQAMLRTGDTEITILDTPGHVDFSSEMERVLSVIDAALLIVSAPDGIQSHTETLWKLLRQRNIPVFVFVNKMDLAVRDREVIVQELVGAFGEGFVDVSRNRESEEFLDDLTLAVPHLADKVLEDQPITDADLASAVRRRQLFPCIFGAAIRFEGVDTLLECLDHFTEAPTYGDTFGARVFKISRDNRGERLAFIKVTGGTLSVKETIHGTDSSDEAWEEKVNQIRLYSGMKYRAVDRVEAGTVCAVTGLTHCLPGDVLGDADVSVGEVLEPFLTYTVQLPEGIDTHTALRDIRELAEEDPKLHVTWTPESGEIGIRLMGEVQLEVLKVLIQDRYGYEVEFGTGQLIYLETVKETVEGVGHFEPLRHYAEVHLLIEPGERGTGVVYDSSVSEDILARNWQRLILSGLEAQDPIGVRIGAPLTDVRITLVAGRAHEKHTSGGDFREASSRAIRHGLMKAQTEILEPWFEFRIELPTDSVGRAMTDIQQMGGRFGDLIQDGDRSIIPGEAPAAGLIDYPLTLASYTGGQGRISCQLKGYDICHNPEEVESQFPYDPERDAEHPADSVFVSHGSSNIVHWDEVEEHMHLPSVLRHSSDGDSSGLPLAGRAERAERLRRAMATDEELQAIFERTYGTRKPRAHRGPTERVGRKRAAESVVSAASPAEVAANQARNEEIRSKHAHKKDDASAREPELILIDGYNVINFGEDLRALGNADIGAARQQLIDRLVNYRGYMQCDMIVVFDAYKVPYGQGHTEVQHGVRIEFTKQDEPADIRLGLMTNEYKNRRLRVVSSDNLVQQNALGHGAIRVSSREFMHELEAVEEEIRGVLADF